MNLHKNPIFSVILVSALVGLDQISKHLARTNAPVRSVDQWIDFHLTFNPGIAFSWSFLSPIAITIISILACLGIIYTLVKHPPQKTIESYGLLLILSGAIGNLIDRILFQSVTDFISVGSFPIFNLADSWISIGVILLLLPVTFKK